MHDWTAGRALALAAALAGAAAAHAAAEDPWSGLRDGAERVVVSDVAVGDGRTVALRLERLRVTSPATRFVVGHAAAPLDFDPGSVRLYRGHVEGRPGSHAFLRVGERGPRGHIDLGGDGGRIAIGGGRAASADDLERLARVGSRPPGIAFCAAGDGPAPDGVTTLLGGATTPPQTQVIELAIETDYEFFQLHSSLEEAAAYVVEVYAAVSDIYLRDVNTRFELTFVRLWDTPDDLFNEESPLSPFRTYWNDNMQEVQRDVAQLFSGRRDMPYGGAAYLGTLCGSSAYSVVGYALGFFPDPQVASIYDYDVHVTAHELGHNCGALHTHSYQLDTCDDLDGSKQRGSIMSYCSQTVSGGNKVTDLRFHVVCQAAMALHIAESECLMQDCNGNGVDDAVDIALGGLPDANGNGVPDGCEDCNGNDMIDQFDIEFGGSGDLNGNGIPDECEPDCNGNGQPDDLDIALGDSLDAYGNGVPDECEEDLDGDGVSDYTQIQQDLALDVDRTARLDAHEDCNGDGTPDVQELEGVRACWVTSVADGPLRRFHAETGVLTALSSGSPLVQGQDLLIDGDGDIYVSSLTQHRVARFDRHGAYLGDFVTPGSGGLVQPTGLLFTPGGTLLVSSSGTDSVLEYDGETGAFLGPFVTAGSGGLWGPFGLAFGPNGNLFVTDRNQRILEYDGQTGVFVGPFVTLDDNGGLVGPRGILFKPGGNLLVASFGTNQVLEYDGATGAFLEQFNHGGTETALTLDGPWGIRLGPDGHVHVSRGLVGSPDPGIGGDGHGHDEQALGDQDIIQLHVNSTRIYVFDAGSGNFLRSYVLGNDTGLVLPTGFDFMPAFGLDCNGNFAPDDCDIASGASLDVNGNGVPDECECPGDVDGSGGVDVQDLVAVILAWGPCPPEPCPADVTADGVVDVSDLVEVLLAWGPCAG